MWLAASKSALEMPAFLPLRRALYQYILMPYIQMARLGVDTVEQVQSLLNENITHT